MQPFDYTRPESVADAIRARADAGDDAAYLAGGTNLVDLMRKYVKRPARVIDVSRLPLDRIEAAPDGQGLRLGATATNTDTAADERVRTGYPVLSQAILAGATQQLRNKATNGGNLLQHTRCPYFNGTEFPCNKREPGSGCAAIGGHNRMQAILGTSEQCIASHPSDMCVALAAMDATVQVAGPDGERSIPFTDFHRTPGDNPQKETVMDEAELITAIDLPAASALTRTSRYVKIRDRASYAFALVSVAAALDVQGGQIADARLALGGVGTVPWRAKEAEEALRGQPAETATYERAAEVALQGAQTYEHNAYKVPMAKRAIVRAFAELADRA